MYGKCTNLYFVQHYETECKLQHHLQIVERMVFNCYATSMKMHGQFFQKKIPFHDKSEENHVYLWYNDENDLQTLDLVEFNVRRTKRSPYSRNISQLH